MAGKILIVEDDRAIVRSLIRLLSREDYYVAVAESAEEAVQHLSDDPGYDLALLDVALPGEDGFACCRRLRAQGWQRPILMLTGRSGREDRIGGLEAGADDYITKPFHPDELLARIHAHLRRSRDYNVPDDQATAITLGPDLIIDLRARDALVEGRRVHLTDREYELLVLLARNAGTALEKTWLFQEIWGCASPLGIKALAVYVRRLRQKIEKDESRPRYLQTVRNFGYKMAPAEDSAA